MDVSSGFEVMVIVVTVVEELCDKVTMKDVLQGAVDVTVEVRVNVSVLVNVFETSECIIYNRRILLTELSFVSVSCVTPLQEQTLEYSEGALKQLSLAYVGIGPMIVVVLEDNASFWRA